MLESRKILPGIQLFSRPPASLGVSRMGVHQPEHLGYRSLAVSHYSPDQQLADERIEGCLVPAGVGSASLKRLLVQRQRDVFHLASIDLHIACVHILRISPPRFEEDCTWRC